MTLLTEKAPVQSSNSDEGTNPNTTKGMILSNCLIQDTGVSIKDVSQLTVSQIKELADQQGVKPSEYWNQTIKPELSNNNISFEFSEPTLTEIAFCEQFADFKLRINYCKESEVFSEGQYRFYGGIAVTPSLNEILINVFVGATQVDFARLKHYVEKIRQGYWNSFPWTRTTSLKYGYEFFRVTLGDAAPLRGERIYPCTEERCENYGEHHLVDRADPTDLPVHYCDLMTGENYRLQLIQEQSEWLVDAETLQPLTPTESASYASDLMWLAAEAKKLNNSAQGR